MLLVQQFNHTRHEFEIFLENQTILNVIPEDDMTKEIPRVQYRVRFWFGTSLCGVIYRPVCCGP